MRRPKRNYCVLIYIAWAVLVSISCISCSISAPTDILIRQDWEFYCGSVLKDSFRCMDMKIIGKSIEGDNFEVFIAARVVKTINVRPEQETIEIKYKLLYKKFDNGWIAIRIDRIV
jgi:hypothetical protein